MADRVTKVFLSPTNPPPLLTEVGGKVRGAHQMAHCLVPVGQAVTVEIKVAGTLVRTLGPWTAIAKTGKNAVASVLFYVSDNNDRDNLDPPVEMEIP